MTDKKTHFLIIQAGMTHLGDDPGALSGNYVGGYWYKPFNLPDNVDTEEFAIIQCRTFNNQKSGKKFLLNTEDIGNILEIHPNNKNEWMMDLAIVPRRLLRPGLNGIHIGYVSCDDQDDFIVDNIVLWYKTSEPEESTRLSVAKIDQERWERRLTEFTEKLEEHKDLSFVEKLKMEKER